MLVWVIFLSAEIAVLDLGTGMDLALSNESLGQSA